MDHPLHKAIGDIVQDSEFPNCTVIRDHACGGYQNIPLFCSTEKSNRTKYCNVDLLILKGNKIQVIIEIEKTNTRPTQICGKFLTSALSPYFIHSFRNNDRIGMGKSVSFIQILDTSKLKKNKTSKIVQFKHIETSINNIVPIKNSNINNYKLFSGDISDFRDENTREKIISYIRKVLK